MITRSRIFSIWLILLVVAAFAVRAQASGLTRDASVPSPRDVLGFAPGDNRKLADWSQIVDYFKKLDAASPRVSVHQAGVSTERRPFVVAIISSEENIQNLSRIREAQRRLADPRLISSNEERERLVRETPAVVAITCSIHSTEIVASQMSMELAYRLASDDSAATKEILRSAVLVLVPSVNPDGIDIVTNWYRKTLGTKFEGTSPPELYHHYTGHDNNRDWFMLTQVETQIVSSLFWREWFPEIVYDVHQQGSLGSRMCVPPFFDPSNPNIDPVILREVGSLGMKMATNLAAAGHHGIVTNSTYDTWWHGGLRTAPYYHNAVGILTEAASVNIATPMQIKRDQLRSPTRGLADPLVAATNFPDPWQGGEWTMRDIMNLELITTRTALEEASLHHDELIRNFVGAATRAIEAGKTDAPYAYIVPAAQHDKPTADRMINILIQQGVEAHRAKSDFTVDGKKYDKGSYVILLAQPYRANVKCLFEAQKYPDRRIYPGGPAEPPYDVAGWTLPMQMGVDYAEAGKRFEAELEAVDSADLRQTSLPSKPTDSHDRAASRKEFSGVFISPNENAAYAEINSRFNISGGAASAFKIWRLKKETQANGENFPAGTFIERREVLNAKPAPKKKRSSADKAIQAADAAGLPASAELLVRPRLAIYRSWSPSMDEGWTRWVLEQFGFDYKTIFDADVRAGNLKDKFDCVILPDQSMQQIIAGNRAGTYPDDYTGGIGDEGVAALKSFVESGGVLICLDSASELAIKKFDLPVKNALEDVRRDQFYAPGSIFRAIVDTQHPVGYGMPSEADLYFVSGTRRGRFADPDVGPAPEPAPRSEAQPRADSAAPDSTSRQQAGRRGDASLLVSAFAFEITDPQRARSVARYIDGNPLRSGWLLGPQLIAGKSALVDVSLGKGRVVLFGFRTQHRAQTWGTFKFLFNSILMGSSR